MALLSVRDLRLEDVELVDNYWSSLTPADLNRMYIDPAKLGTSVERQARFRKTVLTPVEEREAHPLIWEIDGTAVGTTIMRNVKGGESGEIHLHLFDPTHRQQGFGTRLLILSMQEYASRFGLKKIICEPASGNPAPNAVFRRMGVGPARVYKTTPSYLCFEHEVSRYEIDVAQLSQISASVFP